MGKQRIFYSLNFLKKFVQYMLTRLVRNTNYNIVFSPFTVKQPCVQDQCISVNDNPFDNIMKLLYASPFKGASTSFNYHCCSTWQHPCWMHDGKFKLGVVNEQLMILIMSWSCNPEMCLFDTRFLSWWKVEIYIKEDKFFQTFEIDNTSYFMIIRKVLLSRINCIYYWRSFVKHLNITIN